jgi:hypothetical protein
MAWTVSSQDSTHRSVDRHVSTKTRDVRVRSAQYRMQIKLRGSHDLTPHVTI